MRQDCFASVTTTLADSEVYQWWINFDPPFLPLYFHTWHNVQQRHISHSLKKHIWMKLSRIEFSLVTTVSGCFLCRAMLIESSGSLAPSTSLFICHYKTRDSWDYSILWYTVVSGLLIVFYLNYSEICQSACCTDMPPVFERKYHYLFSYYFEA